jgi:hypothetical protein
VPRGIDHPTNAVTPELILHREQEATHGTQSAILKELTVVVTK